MNGTVEVPFDKRLSTRKHVDSTLFTNDCKHVKRAMRRPKIWRQLNEKYHWRLTKCPIMYKKKEEKIEREMDNATNH